MKFTFFFLSSSNQNLFTNFSKTFERGNEGVSSWRTIVLSQWRQMLVHRVSPRTIMRVSIHAMPPKNKLFILVMSEEAKKKIEMKRKLIDE
jgi:hypothetical protein